MARPVDYRKDRGSKGVHTEDEALPIGKKDQGRGIAPKGQSGEIRNSRSVKGGGKHSAGHVGQKAKPRAR
jgi:hypothetical protein